MKKVVKFGGSSLASAEQFRKVSEIIHADKDRRYVVPSAPGKRGSKDTKVTDMLYDCYSAAGDAEALTKKIAAIQARYQEIIDGLGLELSLEEQFKEIRERFEQHAGSDYAASRGEYLNGIVLAAYLEYDFIDAAEVICFDEDGVFDAEKTDEKMRARLGETERAVIPGFYGAMPDGSIKTFSRGGSDITGSIVARAVHADLYENWTDVSGFLVTDPHIVQNPETIETITYRELRELSYMGANVLHSESIFPVKSAGIPIRIRNTFRPEDEGTLIVATSGRRREDNVVTGIAGKKDFTVILLEKSMMNSEIGFAAKVLEVLSRHGISFEHLPSGIDTMSVVIDNKYLENDDLGAILEEIREAVRPDHIYTHENIALVATVGHGMARSVGTSARLFKALSEAGINVIMIDQGSSELNIIVGVAGEDCAPCIRAIYREFFA